jgi:transcriptional regulator with XRE-family HTH domain
MPPYSTGSIRSDSVCDPRIGIELRRFREKNALSGENVAKALRWSSSKISRYERSRSAITRRGLTQILRYYQERHRMPLGQAQALLAMFDQAQELGVFQHAFLGPAVLAEAVREWAPVYVPRLLQVHGYARAVLSDLQMFTGMPPGEIRGTTAAIIKWQARLLDRPRVRLRAVLDESVLYRMAGDASVMRSQLAHLEKMTAAEGADIGIRILPFTASRVPRWTPAFAYLEYPAMAGADDTAEVVTEELEGPGIPVLDEKRAWKRDRLFSQLWDAADEPGPAIKRALADALGLI